MEMAPVSHDNNSGDPTPHFATWGAYDYYIARIPSYSCVDLEATWNVNKIRRHSLQTSIACRPLGKVP
jgi:hypothetical protein